MTVPGSILAGYIGSAIATAAPWSRGLSLGLGSLVAFACLRRLYKLEERMAFAECPRCLAHFNGPNPFGLLPGLPTGMYPNKCQTCGLGLDGQDYRARDV